MDRIIIDEENGRYIRKVIPKMERAVTELSLS